MNRPDQYDVRRTRAARPLALVAVMLGLVPGLPATAAGAAPTELATGDASRPSLASDGAGNAVAVWTSTGPAPSVLASMRTAGGSWSPAAPISDAGGPVDAHVAVSSSGSAIAVWRATAGRRTHDGVWAAVRSAGGTWSAPLHASWYETWPTADPRVAIDGAGNATVVWTSVTGTANTIHATTRSADGTLLGVSGLWTAGSASNPDVAVNAAGDTAIVWTASTAGADSTMHAAIKPAGGAWGPPEDLDAAPDVRDPHAAVDPSGNVIAVWVHHDGGHDRIRTAVRPAGSTWGAPVDLSAAGQDASRPQIVVDASGNATVVWMQQVGSDQYVQAAVRPAGGSWNAPVDIAAAWPMPQDPQVAVDPFGTVTAVWVDSAGSHDVIRAAALPRGGAWSEPTDLSAPGGLDDHPQVVVDALGTATAAWLHDDGAVMSVQAVDFDLVAPAAPATLSVSPRSPDATTALAVSGSAEAGSKVSIYPNASCSGAPLATGTAAAFADPGLPVTVAAGSTTTFAATSTDTVGNVSACSSGSVPYTHVSSTVGASAASPGVPAGTARPQEKARPVPGPSSAQPLGGVPRTALPASGPVAFTIGRARASLRAVTVRFGLPRAGILKVVVDHRRPPRTNARLAQQRMGGRVVLARARVGRRAGGPARVALRFSPRWRRMLERNGGRLRVLLTARYTAADGRSRQLWRVAVVREVRRAGRPSLAFGRLRRCRRPNGGVGAAHRPGPPARVCSPI